MKRAAYFDASAICKLLLDEPESGALVDYLAAPLDSSTSSIAVAEVHCTLRRTRVRREEIEDSLRGFYLIAPTIPILQSAAWLGSRPLRALDAIHLASAHSLRAADLAFVTYDHRLADAARASGLHVVQPGL